MHMRHIAICGLPRSTVFFPHYLINGKIFEKKYLTQNVCFHFSPSFIWNISHSKKNLALGTHHARRMRRILLPSVAFPALQYFSHIIS